MNIGDKVKFKVGCAGGGFVAGMDEVWEVNTRTANWLEDQCRCGHAEVIEGRSFRKEHTESAKTREQTDESADIQPAGASKRPRGGRTQPA